MVRQNAVIVKNATKRYGKGELVLDNLNMTVSKSSIYGLLGASGCGKTTLLSCLVGIRHLNDGEISVLNEKQTSKKFIILGPRVGYMPQETSLIGEFSVSDAFYYFGRINGLDNTEIELKQEFFSKLLQLPSSSHLLKNMSGGEKRRVSFAVALIHHPELLILDEPTVGMDSIMRDNIWNYLIKITKEEGITVLITTHYIEETKNADKIGLMRDGKMLTESSPQQLLERFECSLLEEAFIKLCDVQNNAVTLNEAQRSEPESTSSDVLNQDQDQDNNYYTETNEIPVCKTVTERRVSRWKKFKALVIKNGIQVLRNYAGLVFAILFPLLQGGLFFFSIGNNPKDLMIGIVNDEAGNCNYDKNYGYIWGDEITCHFNNLSCRFANNINSSIATQIYYDNVLEAKNDVRKGQITGVMYFGQNFSKALEVRVNDITAADDLDFIDSEIQVFLDMSDHVIGSFMKEKLFKRFIEIYKSIMKDCQLSPKLAYIPIQFEDPLYGTEDLTYADFIVPTYIIILIFFLANTVSTALIISDRLQGLWDRSIVQGVKSEEILLSHIFIQSIIVLIHTTMLYLLYFPIWGLECKGSIFMLIIIVFLNGFCGLMYGFFLSVILNNYTMAFYGSIGSMFPLFALNGGVWPLEGLPIVLRWISYMMPVTLPSASVRAIVYKGSSIFDSDVYVGLLVNCVWILLYLAISIFGIRRLKSL
ncbi:hypothetical protein PUN28_014027 [Cardiocondyla obscurior]|uniref:ABC transporter G family member 20 n=3 Tax=Cardiocondyla obscurior TaxID=286306 RepID=A0AAW2F4E9_9HYME